MDIQRLANELQDIKTKYLLLKKKERQHDQIQRPRIQPNTLDGPRFTGGGFNLSKGSTVVA